MKNKTYAKILRVVKEVRKCVNPDTEYEVFISHKDEVNAWVNVNNFSKSQEYDAYKMAAEYCSKCFGMSNEKQSEIIVL